MTGLATTTTALPTQRKEAAARDLFDLWLGWKKTERTRETYFQNVRAFALFLGKQWPKSQERWEFPRFMLDFIMSGPGPAIAATESWLKSMEEAGLAPFTINGRLATLRSYATKARKLRVINWTLEVEGVQAKAYKDTKGPGLEKFQLMMDAAGVQKNRLKSARDVALLSLMFDLALRKSELLSLDYGDYRPDEGDHGSVWVQGKGKREKTPIPLSSESRQALDDYLSFRGILAAGDPLFVGLSPSGSPQGRLSGPGLYHLITRTAKKAGIGHVHPHGLRHASITTNLEMNNGNIRLAQAHSRHASSSTLNLYDDNRKDTVGASVRLVASAIKRPRIAAR